MIDVFTCIFLASIIIPESDGKCDIHVRNGKFLSGCLGLPGEECNVICDVGYYSTVLGNITCLDNGNWNSSAWDVCKENKCSGFIAYGTLTSHCDLRPGSSCKYYCDSNRGRADGTIECLPSREWDVNVSTICPVVAREVDHVPIDQIVPAEQKGNTTHVMETVMSVVGMIFFGSSYLMIKYNRAVCNCFSNCSTSKRSRTYSFTRNPAPSSLDSRLDENLRENNENTTTNTRVEENGEDNTSTNDHFLPEAQNEAHDASSLTPHLPPALPSAPLLPEAHDASSLTPYLPSVLSSAPLLPDVFDQRTPELPPQSYSHPGPSENSRIESSPRSYPRSVPIIFGDINAAETTSGPPPSYTEAMRYPVNSELPQLTYENLESPSHVHEGSETPPPSYENFESPPHTQEGLEIPPPSYENFEIPPPTDEGSEIPPPRYEDAVIHINIRRQFD